MADEKYSRLGKEEEDQIHWKVGQQFDDGSTILMVERIEDRAPQVAQNQSLCELFIVSLLPCLWFSYCPYLCMTKANMKTKMKNSALLVTDESVVFYENEWTPKGAGCYTGAVPKSHFTVSYDQLQDVRMDPQGGCETCCSICNPGPGIQFLTLGYHDSPRTDPNTGELNKPTTWQPYSLDEEELRKKKDRIQGYVNEYKKKERELKKIQLRGYRSGTTEGTTGEVKSFCRDCGAKNELMKQFCGDCGANLSA